MTETTELVLDLDSEIGKKYAAPLVSTIRAAVNGVGKYAAYVEAYGVTRDDVAMHARALAVATYPNEAPVQKKNGTRTKFGNAVQAAGNGLRAALAKDEPESKPAVLRLSLSGEGGGTVVVPEDHPMYTDLVAMIRPEQDSTDEPTLSVVA